MSIPYDLEGELVDTELSRDHFAALSEAGVSLDMLRIWNWCRTMRVSVEGPIWWPDPAGSPAVIVLVRARHDRGITAESPELLLTYGEVIDAVAFDLRRPLRWAVRTGAAVALGIAPWSNEDRVPVPIWKTPIDWLKANGEGICFLTPDLRERQQALRTIRQVSAVDEAHRAELQALARWPDPGISIALMKEEEGADEAA